VKAKFTFRRPKDFKAKLDSILNESDHKMNYETASLILRETFGSILYPTLQLNDGSSLTVYRVTGYWPRMKLGDIQSFSCPTSEISAKKPNGRAHITGHPVFYASVDKTTALREMKGDLEVGKKLFISKWKIDFVKKVNWHLIIPNRTESNTEFSENNTIKNLLEKSLENFDSNDLQTKEFLKSQIRLMGDLFTVPHSKYYPFTSAYAHDVLYKPREQNVQVSIIVFPSVNSAFGALNFAIHPELIQHEVMKLEHVLEVEITSVEKEEIKILPIKIAFNENNSVNWYTFRLAFTIQFEHTKLWTYDDHYFEGEKANSIRTTNSGLVCDFVQRNIQNYCTEENQKRWDELKENKTIEKHTKLIVFQLAPNELKINSNENESNIKAIHVPITIEESLTPIDR
jgi:hypothetical protein